jgi:hypothetical protein
MKHLKIMVATCTGFLLLLASAQVICANNKIEIESVWNIELANIQRTTIHDINGDEINDVIVVAGNTTNENYTHLLAIDGKSGQKLWEKHFPRYVSYGAYLDIIRALTFIDSGTHSDILIMYYEQTNVTQPFNITIAIPQTALIDGLTGDILWNIAGMGASDATPVDLSTGRIILISGNWDIDYIGNSFGSISDIYAVDPQDGKILWSIPSHSQFFQDNFIVDKTSNGGCYLYVLGDSNVSAYNLASHSMIWNYDFYNNNVFLAGTTGIFGARDRVAFQASNEKYTNALMILDASTGNEVLVVNLTKMQLLDPILSASGYFNSDDVVDYVVEGLDDVDRIKIVAVDGLSGNVLWNYSYKFDDLTHINAFSLLATTSSNPANNFLIINTTHIFEINGMSGTVVWEMAVDDNIEAVSINPSNSPNFVYAKSDTLYCVSLYDNESSPLYVAVAAIIISVVIASVLILVRKRNTSSAKLNKNEDPFNSKRNPPNAP